jgi:hydrogenase maturation protease
VSQVLILGLGNILFQDEGLGVRAVERLAARYRLPEGVRAIDGGVMGLDLLPYLEGVDDLLILDAVDCGEAPGTLVRLEGDSIPAALSLKMSMHQVGLQELLALAAFEGTLPQRVVLWGLEPASLDWGVGLSATVDSQLDGLVEAASRELAEWGIPLAESGIAQPIL